MKLHKLICFSFILIAGLLVSCKTQKELTVSFDDLNGKWSVTELNSKKLNNTRSQPFVELDIPRHTISGNAGCNRMMGKVEYNPERKSIIRFLDISTTRMACPDMEEEQALLEALKQAVRFAPEEGTVDRIVFFSANNTKLFVLQKQ